MPKCLVSSLQMVCFRGYANEVNVESMIKYILANGKILKSLEIHTADYVKDYEEKFHLLQTVAMFHRASEVCEIKFF